MNRNRLEIQEKAGGKGILAALKAHLDRNRLGELLQASGRLTPIQLREALALQKATGLPLGVILLRQGVISAGMLRRTLARQMALRAITAAVTLLVSFSGLGGVKSARAGTIKDVPASISLVMQSGAVKYEPVKYYPGLFGTTERRSANLKPFTKWSDMFERFDLAVQSTDSQPMVQEWKTELAGYQGLSFKAMVRKVNDYINARPYILDSNNWGQTDYWENPVEFLQRGGDCEDFAIAKYASLRALGVPEERLRLAIVHDLEKDMPHAVLIVYSDAGPLVLDNQSKDTLPAARVSRYKPIFSINRQAWWLHTAPRPDGATVLASAQ